MVDQSGKAQEYLPAELRVQHPGVNPFYRSTCTLPLLCHLLPLEILSLSNIPVLRPEECADGLLQNYCELLLQIIWR